MQWVLIFGINPTKYPLDPNSGTKLGKQEILITHTNIVLIPIIFIIPCFRAKK